MENKYGFLSQWLDTKEAKFAAEKAAKIVEEKQFVEAAVKDWQKNQEALDALVTYQDQYINVERITDEMENIKREALIRVFSDIQKPSRSFTDFWGDCIATPMVYCRDKIRSWFS